MKKNESTQVIGKNQGSAGVKHPIRLWRNYKWEIIILLALGIGILGCMGFDEYFRSNCSKRSLLNICYRTLQLFKITLDPKIADLNWKLELARWMAPIIAAIAAANFLVAVFSEQFQLLKARFFRNHIIICGLGNKGLLLAREFKADGKKVVVIEIDNENDNIKECRDTGSTVLIGNAMAPYILRRAGVKKARHLFSVCGQDNINAEIAFQARELLTSKKNKTLTCIVHITDMQLCRLIKEREFESEKKPAFRLEFLNLFDYAAKTLIDSYPPFDEKKELKASPHILIVGVGHLGESLVVHIAKKWSELPDQAHNRIKISLIDKAAKKKQKLFFVRHPRLMEICDIIPLEMDIDSPEFEEGQSFIGSGECSLSMAYICLNDDSLALSTALTLHHRCRTYDFPIVVRMNSERGLAELIKGDAHGLGRVHGFGLLDRVLTPELLMNGTHEILARAIHEEYYRDQLAKGETPASNKALVPWDELPETLKDSNRRQADYLGVKLRKIGCYIVPMIDWNADPIEFTPQEIEKMAVMEHEDWVEERLKNGWKYDPGPKDIRRKRSPSLIPWDKLSEEEKEKDRNPVRKMPQFLARAGFQIYRSKE